MKAIHFLVTGRVQGVWFRKFTLDTAEALVVTGWVRNNPDGTVEGEAVGTEEDLLRFEEALRQGPVHAHVDDLSVEPASIIDFPGFEIRR